MTNELTPAELAELRQHAEQYARERSIVDEPEHRSEHADADARAERVVRRRQETISAPAVLVRSHIIEVTLPHGHSIGRLCDGLDDGMSKADAMLREWIEGMLQ